MSNFVESANYGAAAANLKGHSSEKYYVSTAIAYMNGHPHIGHAYEFLTTDVLARLHRVLGFDTYFLTGADEHGQKVAASAEKAGRTPLEHCDYYVQAFETLNKRLLISNSAYIRTTQAHHEATSQKLWEMCAQNGDIYLDAYSGWYNEREEVFVTDSDAEAANFMDVGSGLPLKRVTEESYFFRMSKYCDRLIEHIEQNPSFVEPEQYRNNILARLRKEGLKDLSVSRTSFAWGIPVPAGFAQGHVMYVWFDALTNYLSGVHGLDPEHELSGFWPVCRHIIGKDIIWFHCVIWPCMLMSAGVHLPAGVYSHGFVNASDGRKMSKSYGNTIDPHEILDKYPVDSVRYYSCASVTYGADLNFSEAALVTMHNSELADVLGNLVHRAINLCCKYCDGVIPDTQHDVACGLPFDLTALIAGIRVDAEKCDISASLFKAMEAARCTNRFLTEAEPWKMKGEDEARRPAVVRTTLEAVYAFMHFLAPVIPLAAQQVFDKLHTEPRPSFSLNCDLYNLTPGTPVTLGEILFKKIETAEPMEAVVAVVTKKVKNTTLQPVAVEYANDFEKIELRVGRILSVAAHPTAERLYCENIDVGEAVPRPVASGLRQFCSADDLLNRLVVVVCNLKEARMQGYVSSGMVLAAKSADGTCVELVSPPADAVVGERVTLGSTTPAVPMAAAQVKKLKIWESVMDKLRTNSDGVACWDSEALHTSAGICRVQSLADAQVS